MLVSYHNHTIWSDGTATLQEMLANARTAGVDELGISDHYYIPPDGSEADWAMKPDFLEEYVATLEEAAKTVEGFILRIGLEVDYFPETLETVLERLAPFQFDYLIGSVHTIGDFTVDYTEEAWEPFSQDERNDIWRNYWLQIRRMADSRAFDFVGHLDLPKKFSFKPSVDLTPEINAALDAIAEANMAMEINTAGWNKPICQAYPSPELLHEAHLRNIPIVLNSDAHRAEDITNLFAYGRELAISAGYRELLRYEKRKRYPIPI